MKKLSCKEAQRLLTQRSSGVDEARRLRLEFHLDDCGECAQYSRGLLAMTALVDGAANESLSQRERGRALDASLRTLDEPAVSASFRADDQLANGDSSSRWRFSITWQLGAAAVAVAAAAAFVLMMADDHPINHHLEANGPQPPPPGIALSRADIAKPGIALSRADSVKAPPAKPVAKAAHLVSGHVRVAGIALSVSGDVLPQTNNIKTRAGAELAFNAAHIVLGAGTHIDWSNKTRALRLRTGRVVLEVANTDKKLRVVTPDFTVVVIGTSFSVTHKHVEVYRGRVRILDSAGVVLAERLEAGSRWSLVRIAKNSKRPPTVAATKIDAKRQVDPRLQLGKARAALARHQVSAARKHIGEAMSQPLNAAARAEAGTLLAEAAFIEGKLGEATELYLRVADKYRSSSAGQNALYAAARLAGKRGNRSAARKLFKRYLARYPRGQFRTEAARNLLQLNE